MDAPNPTRQVALVSKAGPGRDFGQRKLPVANKLGRTVALADTRRCGIGRTGFESGSKTAALREAIWEGLRYGLLAVVTIVAVNAIRFAPAICCLF